MQHTADISKKEKKKNGRPKTAFNGNGKFVSSWVPLAKIEDWKRLLNEAREKWKAEGF